MLCKKQKNLRNKVYATQVLTARGMYKLKVWYAFFTALGFIEKSESLVKVWCSRNANNESGHRKCKRCARATSGSNHKDKTFFGIDDLLQMVCICCAPSKRHRGARLVFAVLERPLTSTGRGGTNVSSALDYPVYSSYTSAGVYYYEGEY